ncbi:hypothetical protein BJV77DRAFT_965060 [Russula vinacea]|nr:hypothetical protein BJV77DRAFT_965060 [Russula vinacea]
MYVWYQTLCHAHKLHHIGLELFVFNLCCNKIALGLPNQSKLPPNQPLGSEAPLDATIDFEALPVPPMDFKALLVPPMDSKAPPTPTDSEMAPKPKESVDSVQSEAFDGNLFDLTPPSSYNEKTVL